MKVELHFRTGMWPPDDVSITIEGPPDAVDGVVKGVRETFKQYRNYEEK